MDYCIASDAIFDGTQILRGAHLRVEAGFVTSVSTDVIPSDQKTVRVEGIISPGFVDLQVNGGGSVMLNTTPTRDGLQTMANAHRGFGTVAILPTVITDHPDVLDKAASAVLEAYGDRGILGIHVEGPHIGHLRRGTHAAHFIRPMDQRTLDVVSGLRIAGLPVMITVAPESVSPEQISQLAKMGAVVSLGHTDATSEDIRIAIAAGASCGTHLFNAMSPMVGRAAGAVGAIINSVLYSGIICDGYHVADEMIGLAIRARPVPDHMFLVSDSMSTVGGDDHFDLYGNSISLRDGKLVNAEGSLAGAHVTQAAGVKRLVENVELPLVDALKMGSSNPAACMGLKNFGSLEGRPLEDIIILDNDLLYQGDLSSTCFTL